MNPLLIGVNFERTPLEVRERLVVPDDRLPDFFQDVRISLGGSVALFTCNRAEFYAVDERGGGLDALRAAVARYAPVRGFMHGSSDTGRPDLHEAPQVDAPETAPLLYQHEGADAVRHLFRVASGLDSMMLGEHQVLGQVRVAFSRATRLRATSGPISRWFHHAIRVGRRARQETEISRHGTSVSSAAVRQARQVLGGLEGKNVAVVGAGDAAKLAAKALLHAGAGTVMVTSRTKAHAQAVALELGAQMADFEDLAGILAWADVVISATAAPNAIITAELVRAAMLGRSDRPLCLFDIAVPRDVDPSAGDVHNVHVYDVDALEAQGRAHRQMQQKEAVRAETIVEEEVERFMAWWSTLGVVPVVAGIHQHAEAIRQRELARTMRFLPDLTPEQRDRVEALTTAIINQILHQPIATLKSSAAGGDPDLARKAQDLFALRREE